MQTTSNIGELDGLRPIAALVTDRSSRWICDACRAGRFPGAIKVGRVWMISHRDFDAWLATAQGRAPAPAASGVQLDPDTLPTLEQATADLRARGLIT